MTTIEIYSSNYNSFLGLDIIAFSYAEPGAMGERGAVNIAISDGRLLHNVTKGQVPLTLILVQMDLFQILVTQLL